MYCRYCGKELPEDSNYCPNCGKRQKDNSSECKARMPQFINEHKKLSYTYLAWVLVHIAFFLFSSPKGHRYVYGDRRDYDLNDGFYPYNKSIGDIIDGQSYELSFTDNIDVYDFSELFFYTILIPIVIVGLAKSFPFIFSSFKNMKERYRQWQENNTKKRKQYQGEIEAYETPQEEVSNPKSFPVGLVAEDIVSPMQERTEEPVGELNISKETDNGIEEQPQEEHSQSETVSIETEVEIKKMPLFSRFIGTIIDKMLLLAIFVVGSIAISPYGAPGRFGTYIGLRNTPLSLYEYIDKSEMNRYGTYYDGIR